jgi:Flp pilus assembly protein TadG
VIRRVLRRLRAVRRDRRGAAILEFALVAPVMLLGIMSLTEICYRLYIQSVLEGAVQKAARDSAIQGGSDNTTTIDQAVISMVSAVVPSATFNSGASRRENYDNYAAIAPEPFTDAPYNGQPADGVCDHGEPYTDVNNNGSWDADPGVTGQGGASDTTKYQMTVTYPTLFPLFRWIGVPNTQTLSATTMLKNQPYATQTTTTPVARSCP